MASEGNPRWPGGISDGLSLMCSRCGNRPRFDYRVPDEVWKQCVPPKLRRGVICLPCLDFLAVQMGVNLSRHISFVQFIGYDYTVEFKPTFAAWYGGDDGE